MKYITNYDGSVKLPYQHDGAQLLSWLQERYPNSKYKLLETLNEQNQILAAR